LIEERLKLLRGVVWCGVVWCGVVWCGVVWCGVVWCGVVWCGVVSAEDHVTADWAALTVAGSRDDAPAKPCPLMTLVRSFQEF
jgi:hypothetical protein